MEAGLRQVACIVRERQLRLYGHVTRLLAEDPAYRILSCRDPSDWTMPRGRPQASWLYQVESYVRVWACRPGVCLGDGQTEVERVPSQGGRGDALLRRMPPYLTRTSVFQWRDLVRTKLLPIFILAMSTRTYSFSKNFSISSRDENHSNSCRLYFHTFLSFPPYCRKLFSEKVYKTIFFARRITLEKMFFEKKSNLNFPGKI